MDTTAAAATDVVTLLSSDNHSFQVQPDAVRLSVTLQNALEDAAAGDTIPVPNVAGAVLAKVLEFMRFHAAPQPPDADAFMAGFLDVDNDTLFDIILAANYLDIKVLLDAACAAVAGKIKGKTPDEIRHTFGIDNDFTPEEEDAVRRENQWAFE